MTPSWAYQVANLEGAIRRLPGGDLFPDGAEVLAYEVDDQDLDLMVTIRLRVKDGVPILTGLAVGQSPGTSAPVEIGPTAIASLPVRELTAGAAQAVRATVARARDEPRGRGRRTRRPITDDLLTEVARVVTAHPGVPMKTVAKELGCSERTAWRWVAEARRRGLLPDSQNTATPDPKEEA